MSTTNSPDRTPPVPKELLDYLEKHFPDRCPDPDHTDREVWMAAGAARLVRKLRKLHRDQASVSVLPAR